MNLTTHHLNVEPNASLATDVYLPSPSGSYPVVLVRTPYNRKGLAATAKTFVGRRYAFVTQDCRGKFESVGHFTPLLEAVDGQTTLDWIANQPWCNGRIGMWGRSYLGIVQIPAAAG
jgi:putative CocE/NonD family hydrolase